MPLSLRVLVLDMTVWPSGLVVEALDEFDEKMPDSVLELDPVFPVIE